MSASKVFYGDAPESAVDHLAKIAVLESMLINPAIVKHQRIGWYLISPGSFEYNPYLTNETQAFKKIQFHRKPLIKVYASVGGWVCSYSQKVVHLSIFLQDAFEFAEDFVFFEAQSRLVALYPVEYLVKVIRTSDNFSMYLISFSTHERSFKAFELVTRGACDMNVIGIYQIQLFERGHLRMALWIDDITDFLAFERTITND
ncbi:MAG: hypothetical protein WCK96_19090 [Methylococcales bacterium]